MTEGAIRATKHDDGAIDVAEFGNVVSDHIGTRGVHLDNLAEEKAREIEVVDRHVPEQPAGGSQILARCRGWVTAHYDQLFQPADVASGDSIMHFAKRRIEAPIESHHHGGIQRSDLYPAPIDPSQVQVDRLLAEHCLAGAYGSGQQVDVRGRSRGDHDGIDAGVVESGIDIGGDGRAVLLGYFMRSRLDRVVHPGQLGPGMDIDRVGVYASDPACSQRGRSGSTSSAAFQLVR